MLQWRTKQILSPIPTSDCVGGKDETLNNMKNEWIWYMIQEPLTEKNKHSDIKKMYKNAICLFSVSIVISFSFHLGNWICCALIKKCVFNSLFYWIKHAQMLLYCFVWKSFEVPSCMMGLFIFLFIKIK